LRSDACHSEASPKNPPLRKLMNITVNKYYKMNDDELTAEAAKWNIRSYANENGTIERQIIIDALLKKDNANNSRYAIIVSIVALIVSIITFLLKR